MKTVRLGDRVRILCATRLEDGTDLESETVRATPYWIRAGEKRATAVTGAVVGMAIGEQKTMTITVRSGRIMTLAVDVIGIREPRPAAPSV